MAVVVDRNTSGFSGCSLQTNFIYISLQQCHVTYFVCLQPICWKILSILHSSLRKRNLYNIQPSTWDASTTKCHVSLFQPSCFNNPEVETAVLATLTDQYSMTVVDRGILAKWSVDEEEKVTNLVFLTPEGTFETSCCVSRKTISCWHKWLGTIRAIFYHTTSHSLRWSRMPGRCTSNIITGKFLRCDF